MRLRRWQRALATKWLTGNSAPEESAPHLLHRPGKTGRDQAAGLREEDRGSLVREQTAGITGLQDTEGPRRNGHQSRRSQYADSRGVRPTSHDQRGEASDPAGKAQIHILVGQGISPVERYPRRTGRLERSRRISLQRLRTRGSPANLATRR